MNVYFFLFSLISANAIPTFQHQSSQVCFLHLVSLKFFEVREFYEALARLADMKQAEEPEKIVLRTLF